MARRSPRTSGAPVAMKRVEDEIEQELVEVVAAQLVVAVAGQHLGHVPRDLHDGHVEGAAAQVVDQHGAVSLAVGAVGERWRRWAR